MRIAFAGSPLFGAWVLQGLLTLGRTPALVLTQPDRPAGRGKKLTSPPVAEVARVHGLPLVQVADVNSSEVLERLQAARVEVVVVGAFGQIFGAPLLDAVLCVNVHASLLPAYRGAAPINRALAAGEKVTGVTIMRMVEGLDEGPWAARTSVSVSLRDDAGSLGRALAFLGSLAVDQVLDALLDGTVTWEPQEGVASYARKITPRDQVIDARRTVREVHDHVRSLAPDLGATMTTDSGLSMKVWRTWPRSGYEAMGHTTEPGRLEHTRERLFLSCRDGVVELLTLQPVGRSRMSAAEFLRGYSPRVGERLVECAGSARTKEP